MINLLILLSFSCLEFFISYQAFRYRRLYWFAPTIVGYKNRKADVSSKGLSYFTGTIFLIGGIIFLFLFVRGLLSFGSYV